jgi:DNA-binding response OmpR family regulator
LALRLRANRYLVIAASDAIQAVRLARLEPVDLVLLDLGLPGGDGFTVLERLTYLPHHVPVIVLTARAASEAREQVIAAGAVAFLQKPIENSVLLSTIRMVLDFFRGTGSAGPFALDGPSQLSLLGDLALEHEGSETAHERKPN